MTLNGVRDRSEAGGSQLLAAEVLQHTPLIDGHNDLPTALRYRAGYRVDGLDRLRPELHTDIPRLRQGRVGAQFWSVYVPSSLPEPEAVLATLEQIDAVRRLIAAYPGVFEAAWSAAEVESAFARGRIASLIGVEGGHSLAGSLGVLRVLRALGVRYVTLTHNHNTAWADSATDEPRSGGLTADGVAVVHELNRLGILVDLSHTSAATQHAALDASAAPVLFSHSSARAVADHPRNVDDAVLGRLRGNGGVVQITFVPYFISRPYADWAAARQVERERLGLTVNHFPWPGAPTPAAEVAGASVDPANLARGNGDQEAELAPWLTANPAPPVTIDTVVAHIEHARDAAGIDHIGIGGDFDGVDVQPDGLQDVSGYPRLFSALAERGWTRGELEKLAGRNVLRVLRDAEDAAER